MPNLGAYWCPAHGDNVYREHLATVNGEIRVLAADVQHVVDAYALSQSKRVQLRYWEFDDDNYRIHRETLANPEATGRGIADNFRRKIDEMRRQAQERNLVFPPDSALVIMGMNEPHIWEASFRAPFVRQEVAFLDRAAELGFKAEALRCATGHPADLDAQKRPIWDYLTPVYDAIKRGGHRLDLHEYWFADGPATSDMWGWNPGRHLKCPWLDDAELEVDIGEAGVDLYVLIARWEATGKPQRGWMGNVSPEAYVEQWDFYFSHASANVVNVFPFLLDYQARTWWSFDIKGCLPQLNAWHRATASKYAYRKRTSPQPKPQDKQVFLPIVGSGEGESMTLTWPADGPITQRFGENAETYKRVFDTQGHNGVDIGAAKGAVVRAFADGEVAFVGTDAAYGNYVRVYHEALALHSFYAHLDSSSVQVGQRVRVGQEIARSGASGLTGKTGLGEGPHLHFEIRLGTRDAYGLSAVGQSKGRVDPQVVFAVLTGKS